MPTVFLSCSTPSLHSWVCIAYNNSNDEVAWICTRCQMYAMLNPETNMEHYDNVQN